MAAAEVKPSTPRSILRREAPARSPTEGATRKTVTFEVRQHPPRARFSARVSPAFSRAAEQQQQQQQKAVVEIHIQS